MKFVPTRKTHPCPKCNRTLIQSGELIVTLAGETVTVPTFQCDECLMQIDLDGEPLEISLTFAVDASGRVFDPADPDGTLRL